MEYPEEMPEKITGNAATPDPARRTLLAGLLSAGLLSAYTASLIPWALAQPAADLDHGAFLAVSALLAGRQSLDAAQATRLYGALSADDPGFPAATRALLALLNERQIDLLQLQQVLDAEHSPLAALPRKIVTAWFMGIVGSGAKVRCLAYETALNAVVVADKLKPPTYAYGVYGSWAKKPL
ncbi:sorbitol dehydrogenase family protein [Herminiimonas sp. CN]|uniref:sorbitol dehydrogenase family protein n=1 Tax=Herminiimonas sp. CN TaxID=1349818 RepID=UPI001EE66DF5|nr:sorbitol dehydrogenase family protein [Herminiimonas sp. CN]